MFWPLISQHLPRYSIVKAQSGLYCRNKQDTHYLSFIIIKIYGDVQFFSPKKLWIGTCFALLIAYFSGNNFNLLLPKGRPKGLYLENRKL